MRRALLVAVVAIGLFVGFHVDVRLGGSPADAVTPTPVPSCQFAGYDTHGSLINSTIVCATPGAGGNTNIVSGVCTSPSPVASPTGGVAVNYTCATPGPQATPSPAATGCGTVTGVWPYTIDTTACSGGGGGGATYQSYDQMVEADHPSQYVRLASDCSDTITANPGWAATGTPTFGSASLIFDGSLSTTFPSTGNFCSLATNAPAFLENTYSNPFTVGFWFKYPALPTTGATIFSAADPTGNTGFEIRVTATTGAVHIVFPGVADEGAVFSAVAGTVYYMAVVINPNPFTAGTNTSRPFWQVYENGASVASGNDVPLNNAGDTVSIGSSAITSSPPGGQGVLVQKLELYYGTTLSAPRILAHYNGGHSGVYN